MTAELDRWAWVTLVSVAPNGGNRGPYLGWYEALLAVMKHETGYGRGWRGAGAGSFNMGALQSKSQANPCPPGTFAQDDSHPDGTKYHACFKAYASAEDGMRDFLKVILRAPVSNVLDNPDANGNLSADDFAKAMHDQGYFEGFCPGAVKSGFGQRSVQCHAEAIAGYASALAKSAKELSLSNGVELSFFRSSELPGGGGSSPQPTSNDKAIGLGFSAVALGLSMAAIALRAKRKG